jgi:hypothetical protein
MQLFFIRLADVVCTVAFENGDMLAKKKKRMLIRGDMLSDFLREG